MSNPSVTHYKRKRKNKLIYIYNFDIVLISITKTNTSLGLPTQISIFHLLFFSNLLPDFITCCKYIHKSISNYNCIVAIHLLHLFQNGYSYDILLSLFSMIVQKLWRKIIADIIGITAKCAILLKHCNKISNARAKVRTEIRSCFSLTTVKILKKV